MFRLNLRIKASFSALLMVVLGVATPASAAPSDELFQAFGGRDGLLAVTDQFLWNLADDHRINHHFVETNIVRFRTKLYEQFCQITGGPCSYSGDSMEVTHRGMTIDTGDFNVVVEALIEAMEANDIPTGAQNRLLKELALFFPDIVTH